MRNLKKHISNEYRWIGEKILFGDIGIRIIEYADDWLYYSKRENENSSLLGFDDEIYRVRVDGTENQKVSYSP